MPDMTSPVGYKEQTQDSNGIPAQSLEFTGQEQVSDTTPVPQQTPQYVEEQQPNPQYAPQQEYIPNVEQYQPQQYEVQPEAQHSVEERQIIPESETPPLQYELNPNQLQPRNREGENVFINPNLDPSLGHTQPATTVTPTVDPNAVKARIGGYPVSHVYGGDPTLAIVQQTVAAGDPQSANTWQATVVDKIVRSLLNILGINR